MQAGQFSHVAAIASRDIDKAHRAAKKLGIPKAYGSYEELLADPAIDAVYIPLPNHLHVEWSLKAMRAGKHVLCEKPLAMNSRDAELLANESKKMPKIKLMEAFMYRHHPQTIRIKSMIDNGIIGDVRAIHSMFTYFNDNPKDVRNQADIGGGGLLDIGCYCISLTRFLFGSEPLRACGTAEYDPKLKIDRLVSAVLEFAAGSSTFTCSTQLPNHQYAKVFGTRGIIEIETPFTPNPERPSIVVCETGPARDEIIIDPCNHYTVQGDLFSVAILNNGPIPTPIEDGVANMKVIDRIFESSRNGTWMNL